MTTEYLDLRHLLAIHDAVLLDDEPTGIHDVGLLDSACARPQATAFGEDAYPTIWEKAAALLHSLACNHGFQQGNKRTAWVATTAFLGRNGHPLMPDFDEDEGFALVLAVAEKRITDIPGIASELVKFCS